MEWNGMEGIYGMEWIWPEGMDKEGKKDWECHGKKGRKLKWKGMEQWNGTNQDHQGLSYYTGTQGVRPCSGLVEMLGRPGRGPSAAKKLHDELRRFHRRCPKPRVRSGKVASLDGFGGKSQTKILSPKRSLFAASSARGTGRWTPLQAAKPILEALRGIRTSLRQPRLRAVRGVGRGDVGHRLRCRPGNPAVVIAASSRSRGSPPYWRRGGNQGSVLLESGIQADLVRGEIRPGVSVCPRLFHRIQGAITSRCASGRLSKGF